MLSGRTMVEKELLELIACPETHQSLREAPADVLARLNARIAQGALTNRGGTRLQVPLAEGLLREDGRVLYPVLDGIPMLIVDEAVDVGSD
jgi:uncharacterized protein YbaR (Trm112 family)